MHKKHKSFTAKWGKETGVWEEQQEGKEIAKAQKSDAKNVEVEKEKTRKISEQKRKKRRERKKKK